MELLLSLRRECLASGMDALKHWDWLDDALRRATRFSTSAGALVTSWRHDLSKKAKRPLGAPNSASSAATLRLVRAMDADGRRWTAWLASRHAEVVALARIRADEAREAASAAHDAVAPAAEEVGSDGVE